MVRIISKIILVAQILIVALPLSGLIGFAGLFLGFIAPALSPVLFVYASLENFLALMLPLFIIGAIFAYFAKSRGLLYGHVFLLFLAFAVFVLFVWGRGFYSQF